MKHLLQYISFGMVVYVTIISYLSILVVPVSVFGSDVQEESEYDGLSGGYAGPTAATAPHGGDADEREVSGPPMNPGEWERLEENLLETGEVWGARISPRAVFPWDEGFGLLYASRPSYESAEDGRSGEKARRRSRAGLARGETGSLLFAKDLFTWKDYDGNPVLEELQPWQGGYRVHTQGLTYDPSTEEWIVYFGDGGGDYDGIRAVSVARSQDMKEWEYLDRPILTIHDYLEAAPPERIQSSHEEQMESGRVYVSWVVRNGGEYVMRLIGTDVVGEEREYSEVLLRADSPEGPFEPIEERKGEFIPAGAPAYWNGRWYSVFTDTWDGEPGIGLAWSDRLTGPYTKNPENPVVVIENTTRTNPLLFRFQGNWVILYAHQTGDYWEPTHLRMAIAGGD